MPLKIYFRMHGFHPLEPSIGVVQAFANEWIRLVKSIDHAAL